MLIGSLVQKNPFNSLKNSNFINTVYWTVSGILAKRAKKGKRLISACFTITTTADTDKTTRKFLNSAAAVISTYRDFIQLNFAYFNFPYPPSIRCKPAPTLS